MTDNKPIYVDGVDVNGCEYLYTDKYNDKCCRASIGGDALCKPSEMICFKYVEILRQQLARQTQSEAKLVKQLQTICDFINNRPETFKGMYGDVAKIITEYAERKEQECEGLKGKLKYTRDENVCLKESATDEQLDFLALNNYIKTSEFQIDQLKVENERLKRKITEIFACLIKANRTNKIVDTIWVDDITTLWDYIAQSLGIEGDQIQIEKQVLQKIRECEDNNE